MDFLDRLQINPQKTKLRITGFIEDYVKKVGAEGIAVSVSGGIDSATTIALCTEAIGSDKVLGVCMPEEETRNQADSRDVKTLAKKLGFKLQVIDLTEVLKMLYNSIPAYDEQDRIGRGNLKARTRMVVLYYYANSQNRIIAGSSDKSESMIGYFTKWGDGAADVSPLLDLYKTQVRQLGRYLNLPKRILEKPSTPALWQNQIAEKEIGMRYQILDQILYGLEHFMTVDVIAEKLQLPLKEIAKIQERWLESEHKRQMPATVKLQYRTINQDFRLNSKS